MLDSIGFEKLVYSSPDKVLKIADDFLFTVLIDKNKIKQRLHTRVLIKEKSVSRRLFFFLLSIFSYISQTSSYLNYPIKKLTCPKK